MALIEGMVEVPTKVGRMPSFVARPDAGGPFPAIIFYMDAPGFREELCNMARRIAKAGYYCILPDMYYRLGTIRLDLSRRTDAMTEVFRGAMNSLTNADVTDDTAGMLAFLDAQADVASGPVGCVGHCMSGRYVTTVAGRFPTRIKAAASMYGVGIVTDQEDSPHLLLGQVQGELLFIFAETDGHVPQPTVDALKKTIKKTGVKATVEQPKGTEHGFQFPARPVYAPVPAEAAWDKLFALWERNLKKAPAARRK
ncbi:MAG: hydrolase [Rhodospirillaceae bacterium]|nr:hydrolase [Magnetovibrio sp.]MAY66875.1 hydrolase [Rhodospirillaceae bacterium]